MVASGSRKEALVFLIISCPIILGQIVSTKNIILECISIFYCNGNVPVCGTNGTHCWNSKSDCERVKFNCLQLYKKDFDKIDLSYCGEFTVGEIKECCVRKKCSDKKEQICAQTATLDSSGKKCRWFKNRCEFQNHNCGNKTEMFKEIDKSFCNFEYGNTEQQCMESNAKKNETFFGS